MNDSVIGRRKQNRKKIIIESDSDSEEENSKNESDLEKSKNIDSTSDISTVSENADETNIETNESIIGPQSRLKNKKPRIVDSDDSDTEEENSKNKSDLEKSKNIDSTSDISTVSENADETNIEKNESIIGPQSRLKNKKPRIVDSDDSDTEEENSKNKSYLEKSKNIDSTSDISTVSENADETNIEKNESIIGPQSRLKNKKPRIVDSDDSDSEEDDSKNETDLEKSKIIDSPSNISTSSQNADGMNISVPNESIIEPLHNLTPNNETMKSNSNIEDMSVLNYSEEVINSSILIDNDTDLIPETDEEDNAMESRCFSPRTRQSMGFKNYSDFATESSDDDSGELIKTENRSEMSSHNKDEQIEASSSKTNYGVSNSSIISLSSSSDEEIQIIRNNTPKPKLIQQKITNYTPKKLNYVTQQKYDSELHQISELKSNLKKSKDLLKTLINSLPDDGASLKLRISTLENNLEEKTKYLMTITVKADGDNEGEPKRKSKSTGIQNVVDDWSKITEAINAIQPLHTGKIGLNTFNTQKALTVDRLRQFHESLETCPSEDTLAIPPKGLRVDLMDHQKHALAWMLWREKQKPKGGILADDMGLGKTLSMISLVLEMYNREISNVDKEEESESSDDEIEDDDKPKWAGRGRRPDIYQGGTLVVCPASLINQWEKEVENRLKRNLLAVCVHHGNKRDVKPKYLSKNDVVITTYAIVSRECKTQGALYQIKWQRIILDEAHIIRNHKSQQSQACVELKGSCRWALTGTPIQNKEMDLFALLKFLRCSPFNDLEIYKKWIGNNSEGAQSRLNNLIKPLLLRRTKQKLQETGGLHNLPTKNIIIVPVKLNKGEMNVYQRIMSYSKTLFSQFLHQRAEKENNMVYQSEGYKPSFLRTKDPNAAFDKMHKRMAQLGGSEDIRAHQILVYILRLRQICCHPGLIDAMLEDDNNSSEENLTIPEIDLLEQLNKLDLNASDNINNSNNNNNSIDTAAISRASSKLLLRSNPVFDISRPSAKFIAVLNLIEKEILPVDDKVVIVSQWTSVLNLLEIHLQEANIQFVKLCGNVAVAKRNDLVIDFNKPSSKIKVMLLSLTAGGVGLNLVGGNHLLLIDPHWNPQLEAQAQDRIYRVGQTKPVKIYKFLCQETIEERIHLLQETKLRMATDLLNGVRHQGGSKLSLDDMKALFGM